jgi:hypothetical protein
LLLLAALPAAAQETEEKTYVPAQYDAAKPAAPKYARYDYQFIYGEGAHNGNHGGAILPDSLRWLWRDYKLRQ